MKTRSILFLTIIGLHLFLGSVLSENVIQQHNVITKRFLEDSKIKISPSSVSFLTQSYITFSGIQSPKDVSKIELFNSSQSVQLKIIQKYSDSIRCYFIGGIGGDFQGRISFQNGKIVITDNQIEIKVKINSISPNQGNYKGGVILTIKGDNFSFANPEIQVLVGDIQCDIFQSSDQEVKCITRPALNSEGKKGAVTIKNGSLFSISDSSSNVEYTFIKVLQQPTITKIGSNQNDFIMGETVIIEGTYLFVQGQQTFLFFGEQILNYQKAENGLTFIVPYDLMKNKYDFVLYVGQNGQTELQSINILFLITKLLCLNPDNQQLYERKIFFLGALITGFKTNSKIEIQYNSQTARDNLKILFQSQKGFIVTGSPYDPQNKNIESIEQILINGNKMLHKPIKFVQQSYPQSEVDALCYIKTHPEDPSSFQLTPSEHYQNSNLDIYEVFIIYSDNNFDLMIKESKNTFKFKKSKVLQKVEIKFCSNLGYKNVYLQNHNILIQLQKKVIRLSHEENVQSGDILTFKIPNPNYLSTVLCILCPTQKYVTKIEDLDLYEYDQRELFRALKSRVDIYQVYPHKQEGDQFQFKLPTILKRPKAAKAGNKLCNMLVLRDSEINLMKQKQRFQEKMNNYKKYFLKELQEQTDMVENDQAESNLGENDSEEQSNIGEEYLQMSSNIIQEVYLDAITPVRENIYVLNIEPKNLSSYGYEQVVITGNKFLANNNNISSTKVQLLGVECNVLSVTDSQIVCTSGEKMFYNILEIEETIITIGKKEAFMFTSIRYYFDLSDRVKFRYFNDEFMKTKNLYVPSQYGLFMDISEIFSEQQIQLGNISVDGFLILKSSRDLNIFIETLNGVGDVSIGTDMERINNKINIEINDLSVSSFSSYGKKLEKYSYKLQQSVAPDSDEIQLEENQISLQKGSKILILSTTINEENEEFVVSSVYGNKIKLSGKTQFSHKNLFENHKRSNGDNFQFKIDSIVLSVDRSLTIQITKMEQLKNIVDTDLNILNKSDQIMIEQFTNSILKSDISNLQFRTINQGILFIQNNSNLNSEQIQDSYLLKFKSNLLNSLIISQNYNQKIINNFIQMSVNVSSNTSNPTELSKNLIVQADTCFIITNNVIMKENICFSVNSVLNQIHDQLITSTELAIAGLDIRKSLITQTDSYSNQELWQYKTDSQKIKIFVIANTQSLPIQNQPILLRITKDYLQNKITITQIINFEIKGFGLADQNKLISQVQTNNLNVIEINKFQSDISKTSQIFDYLIKTRTIMVDEDGSLTGKKQGLITQSLQFPKLNSSLNFLNQITVSKQIGVLYFNIRATRLCKVKSIIPELDGEVYPQFQFIVNSLEDISTFRFLDSSKEETVPCYFSLQLGYLQDTSKSIIIKYKLDTSQFDVKIYSDFQQYNGRTYYQQTSSNISSQNCQHGQYYLEADGISICFKKILNDIKFSIFSKGFYPYIIPKINNFQSSIEKKFVTDGDWYDGNLSTKSNKRWRILQNWNMVLNKEGEIVVPSLDIQGTLTIDLQGKSATIKTGGISISGGQIIIKSGKITFEFINDDSSNPIFVDFLQDKYYLSKSFLIFGKFISNIDDQMQELQQLRLSSIDQSNKKRIIISQISSSEYFQVDDTITIISPITSQTFKAQIKQIITPYNSSTKTITVELDIEILYNDQFINKTYLQKELDFRPLVTKVNRSVIIKNANIFIRSYRYEVIPEVNFVGVQFIDSTIQISKSFKTILVKNSSFTSVNQKIDNFVLVVGVIDFSKKITSKIQFYNNFFSDAQKHIKASMFKKQNFYFTYDDPLESLIDDEPNSDSDFDMNNYDSEVKRLSILNLEKNILINASSISVDITSIVNMKENIIIKSSESCFKSYFCPITSFDKLYDCGNQGIQSQNCNKFSNVVVARSKKFSSAPFATYTSVISIENNQHFQYYPQNYFGPQITKLKTVITQSAIVFNLFKQNGSCQPQILLSTQLNHQLNQEKLEYFSFFANFISEVEVFDFKCPQNSIIKILSSNEIQTFININKSTCAGCTITINDLISLDQSITKLPDSFRVQDTNGNFINPGSNKPLAYIKQNNNQIKQIEVENPLNALFIQQINNSPDTIKSYYQFDNDKVNAIPSFENYAIAYLKSNQQYDMVTDKQLENIFVGLESSNNVKQYVILKILAKESYQLIIKDQYLKPILPTPFNIDSPSTDLLKLVGNDIAKLKCGMNIQDKDTLHNFIVITAEDDCQLNISEVQSTILKFKIATPILPPPTPEEEGMCDADRRTVYVVQRISNLLGIEKSRARLLGRSQGVCSTRLRFLDQNQQVDEYIFIIDPISSNISQEVPQDPAQKKEYIKEQNNNDVLDMVNVISNINNLLLSNQAEQGFKIQNIDVQIPKFDTSSLCPSGQFREQEKCVSQCSSNHYVSGNICFPCNQNCNGCKGSTKYDCDQCKEGSIKMVDSFNKNYCGKCSDNCKTCQNEDKCIECKQNFLMNESTCVTVCPGGKYESGNKCEVCPSNCKTCSSQSICTSCMNGKTLNSDKLCTDTSTKPIDNSQNGNENSKQLSQQLKFFAALLLKILFIVF